jgi:hypothetical protein
MATYYWVGGAGTWNASTTTNWAASSGGAGSAGVPTATDNAIFDTLSNATAYAVTIGTNAVCLDVTIAGPAVGNVTITSGATAVINVFGSWTSAATGVVFTTTSGASINFLATTTGKTITTNNVTLGNMNIAFAGVGGGWTLGSAITCNGVFTNSGTFNTGNFAMTVNSIQRGTTLTAALNLGSSTITCSGSSVVSLNATNFTLNAGTSTIIGSNATTLFGGAGLTYYNVSFTATTAGTITITGANTYNNLTQASNTTSLKTINFGANQTINGTLTLGATNTAALRIRCISDVNGTQRTLTVATIATLADVDFQDIVAAGASGTWSGTRLGNGTNNSNITFGAGKTVYWNLAGAQNWNATGWAPSSGGTPAVNNFPLAQDTAVFDDTGAVTGTITIAIGWNLPTINITKTGAMTLASGAQAPRLFGSLTLQAATVTTGTGAWSYAAYGVSSTFTSNGATFTPLLTINAPTGTLTLGSALTQPSTVTTTLTAGTLNLSSYTLTTGIFSSNNSNIRTLAFGTGNITLTGVATTIFNTTTVTNMTITGTAVVNCVATTGTSVQTRTLIVGAHVEAQAISVNINPGTSAVDIFRLATTSSGLKDVTFSSTFTGTIQIANGIIVYGNFDVGGTTAYLITASSQIGFYATSGTQNINFRSLNFGTAAASCTIVFGSASSTATYLLTNGFTSLSTAITPIALNAGTLDLNNQTLTATSFSSSGGTARTLAMGTGKIVITGNNGTVCTTNTGTNLTITGSKRIELNYSGSTGLRTLSGPTNATFIEGTNLLDYFITAGTDTVVFSASRNYGTIDFSNGGTSTFTGTWANGSNTVSVYGDLILKSGMVVGSGAEFVSMRATSGTKTITSAGQTMDFPFLVQGVGGTFSCSDALTMGSTREFRFNTGTLQLKAGVTSTVGSFTTLGTNQRFLQSTISGTQATISQASGTVDVSYLTIQDSNATGGATFNAYPYNFNSDAGNNTGWNGLSISDFAIGNVGNVTYNLLIALIGVNSTGAVGTVGLANQLGLTGNVATGDTGTVAGTLSKGLTGDNSDGNVGTVGFGKGFDLTGVNLTGAVGTVTNGVRTVGLTGDVATGNVGTPVAVYWKPINTEQTPSWAQISTAQTPSWTQNSTTQTPSWTQINTQN